MGTRERLVDGGERRVALRRAFDVELRVHRDESVAGQSLIAEERRSRREAPQLLGRRAGTGTAKGVEQGKGADARHPAELAYCRIDAGEIRRGPWFRRLEHEQHRRTLRKDALEGARRGVVRIARDDEPLQTSLRGYPGRAHRGERDEHRVEDDDWHAERDNPREDPGREVHHRVHRIAVFA